MTRLKAVHLAILLAVVPLAAAAAQQMSDTEQRALRIRIEERFDVVPLTGGIALTPKQPIPDVRLIEVTDGAVAINGVPVSGSELRDRLGAGADVVLRLSYLDAEARREVFARPEPEAPAPDDEPVERDPAAEPTSPPSSERAVERRRRSRGDRVRIFGNVSVDEHEEVGGQVVAVMGSVRINGTVDDQVVAVMGSVDLGPNAVVRGDVVSVGGAVRRSPGAQVRGSVTEVALGGAPNFGHWGANWRPYHLGEMFGAVPRLLGSGLRYVLLVLLAWLCFVLARGTVEASAERVSDNPVKATLIGLFIPFVLLPLMVLTAIVLVMFIIGIPLLLLFPFLVLALIVMAVVGFAGVAYSLGGWARRRFGIPLDSPYADIAIGVLVVFVPLLIGRLIALAGWPVTPVSMLFVATGVAVEFIAWASGFGAVVNNSYVRWQARRTVRVPVAPPPAPPPPAG